MDIETIDLILAIKEIENKAGIMKHEANMMNKKADGLLLAAEELRTTFNDNISIFENKRKVSKS